MNDGHQMGNNTVKLSVGVAEGKVQGKVQFDHNYKISLVASARACARKEGGIDDDYQMHSSTQKTVKLLVRVAEEG